MQTYVKGIDVSRWQPTNLDWVKIAEDYKFVFIKVTQGESYSNKHIKTCLLHALNASKAGLKIGYYHYAEPDPDPTDALTEARYFRETLHTYGFPRSPFPYVLDIEEPQITLSKYQVQDWIHHFRHPLEDKGIILYSYTPWLTEHLPEDHIFSDLPLWIAQYPKTFDIQKPPKLPKGWEDYTIWQYSNSEKVPLISGGEIGVDANLMHPDFWVKYVGE